MSPDTAHVAEERLQIVNELGMPASAATKFVQAANKCQSSVLVEKDGQTVNGKSIMGVLMLVAAKGTFIPVRCEGPDAVAALQTIASLVREKFGEE